MTTLSDVLKAVREVIVMNERVTELSKRVERMDDAQADLRDRMVRMEVFFDIVRPVMIGKMLPAPRK